MIKLILAAGQGKRLKKTLPKGYPYITKALIPFNGEPALKRLLRQVNENVQGETIIVLGHESEIIKKTIEIKSEEIIVNKNFMNDSNLESLYKAFSFINNNPICTEEGILIIEADSFFQTNLLTNFISYLISNKEFFNKRNTICWTTKGLAENDDIGGFVEPLEKKYDQFEGSIFDIYISNKKKSTYTKKLYGLTWFNENSFKLWLEQAKLSIKIKTNKNPLYFHDVIFTNKNDYCMKYYDMSNNALSFNDYKEYVSCLKSN